MAASEAYHKKAADYHKFWRIIDATYTSSELVKLKLKAERMR